MTSSEVKTIEIKRFSSYGDNSIETPSLDVQSLFIATEGVLFLTYRSLFKEHHVNGVNPLRSYYKAKVDNNPCPTLNEIGANLYNCGLLLSMGFSLTSRIDNK